MSGNVLKNKILLGLMKEFEKNFSLPEQDEAKSFERFANYTIFSKIDPDAFSDVSAFSDVDVDAEGTFGVDAFGLFVNDTLITNKSDIEHHRKLKRLDVRFVFVQTKRSSSIDSGDILKFTAAVKNIFSDVPGVPLSEEMQDVKELINEVFALENARLFANKKPSCELYFVTAGKSVSDSNIIGIISNEEGCLKNTIQEIGDVRINHKCADDLIDLYNEVENRYSVLIRFDKNLPCASINDVEQAFIGYLPVSEFLRIITGSDGAIRKNIFYENVRDFQGADNSVNTEIAETLSEGDMIDKFIILNNGVTIVARSFANIRSTEYEMSDYYIVNGCQTSNVIFRFRDRIGSNDKLHVPVKFIHTTSNDLIAKLIKSTNRQTPVPDEAFVSLEKFHKRLQEFYRIFSLSSCEPIFYERRSKEYINDAQIERSRIVNLHSQIRSFTAIMLGEPHLTMSNNPSSILKEHRERIFRDDHKHIAYFLPSLLLLLFNRYMMQRNLGKKYSAAKYWICWISRIIISNKIDASPPNSAKLENECQAIVDWIGQEKNNATKMFDASVDVFNLAQDRYIRVAGQIHNNELVRRRAFRDEVKLVVSEEMAKARSRVGPKG